jgi:hypothetical protein
MFPFFRKYLSMMCEVNHAMEERDCDVYAIYACHIPPQMMTGVWIIGGVINYFV